jgi:7-cyano-7-deazaguanine synthase
MTLKAVVSLSGGVDSTTALAQALLEEGRRVEAVAFTYGAKHNGYENEAAAALAHYYDVPLRFLDLFGVMRGFRSALLDADRAVQEGHYEEESMRQTVVPGRNLIFIAVLTGIAVSEDADEIWLGVHAGDHYIYPDCRPKFVHSAQYAVEDATDRKIALRTPYLHMDKAALLRVGLDLKVPYRLTRTCYQNQPVACGRCGACQERLAAFRACGQDDPIDYVTREALPKGVA